MCVCVPPASEHVQGDMCTVDFCFLPNAFSQLNSHLVELGKTHKICGKQTEHVNAQKKNIHIYSNSLSRMLQFIVYRFWHEEHLESSWDFIEII